MVSRKLFVGPILPRMGPKRNQFERTSQISKPAPSVPDLEFMTDPYSRLPKFVRSKLETTVKDVTGDLVDQALKGATEFILPSKKKRGGTLKQKGPKVQAAKALTANGSITQSSTYFGKVPRVKMISTSKYRIGTRKEVTSAGLDLGDLAASFGTQKAFAPTRFVSNTDLRYDQENIKDTLWSAWKAQVISVQGSLMFNNNDIANGFLDIYECVARVNTSVSTLTAWTNGAADISASYTPEDIGSQPYRVPGFNRLWKVIKRTKVPLSPGCTHRHNFRYGSFRPYTNVDISLNDTCVKGQTFEILIVVSGTPVRTTAGLITTSTPIITMAGNSYRTTRVVDNSAPFYSEGPGYVTIDPINLIIREPDGDVVTGAQAAATEN